MSVLDGPGEGTWSVFAQKVVEERDELRYKLAGEAAHIKSLEDLLVAAANERDALRAEVEMLRGVGCRETKDGEPESGPCGVCLRCAEERGAEDVALRIAAEHRAMVAEYERDELKTRLAHAEADAEQAIHNEAFNERRKIAEWIRTTSRARGVLISIHSSQDLARVADAIEQGEHE